LGGRADRARCSLNRGGEDFSPIEEAYYIGKKSSPLAATYQKAGAGTRPHRLLYDARRVEPAAWLAERLGDVTIIDVADNSPAAEAEPAAAPEPYDIAAAVLSGQGGCDWLDILNPDGPRLCGGPINPGGDWCAEHLRKYARGFILSADWIPLARFGGIDIAEIVREDEAA
jgi:hypothetical protein